MFQQLLALQQLFALQVQITLASLTTSFFSVRELPTFATFSYLLATNRLEHSQRPDLEIPRLRISHPDAGDASADYLFNST
jgi:hypothetical protein